MKVLIIEQEKTIKQSLSFFMQSQKNAEVYLAGSKKEGMFLFDMSPFDLVLCGEKLPDGNGLEILKAFVRQNPNLISVLMTARGDSLLKQEALEAGIRGYLEKPFNLQQLEEAMGVTHP
jgi:two-component system, NtrC family, response regulator AtoC